MPQGKPVYYVLCVIAAVIVMCSCIALQLCSQVLFYSVATVCLELPLHDPDLLSSIATAWLRHMPLYNQNLLSSVATE